MPTQRERGVALGRAILVLALVVMGLRAAGAAGVALNAPAPDFRATTIAGETFSLSAERGQVVVITYWASWCKPCDRERPLLDDYVRKHGADGLKVIAVSIDRGREIEKARQMAGAFPYPAALAAEVVSEGLGPPAGVPTTFIVGRDGVLRAKLLAIHAGDLDRVVGPLLAAPAVSQ